ncbi:hypothetical protein LY76DRAFT_303778 [Colletotrichum caudatum]|nr:hypothetical protein LY76DRAFT_303778 [Colletotrichum caudatum]
MAASGIMYKQMGGYPGNFSTMMIQPPPPPRPLPLKPKNTNTKDLLGPCEATTTPSSCCRRGGGSRKDRTRCSAVRFLRKTTEPVMAAEVGAGVCVVVEGAFDVTPVRLAADHPNSVRFGGGALAYTPRKRERDGGRASRIPASIDESIPGGRVGGKATEDIQTPPLASEPSRSPLLPVYIRCSAPLLVTLKVR